MARQVARDELAAAAKLHDLESLLAAAQARVLDVERDAAALHELLERSWSSEAQPSSPRRRRASAAGAARRSST